KARGSRACAAVGATCTCACASGSRRGSRAPTGSCSRSSRRATGSSRRRPPARCSSACAMRSAADRPPDPPSGPPSFLHLPGLRGLGARFTLEGEEAHYARRVVRLREGERATATDGAGLVAVLRVERVKPDLTVLVESASEQDRPAPARLLCGAPE